MRGDSPDTITEEEADMGFQKLELAGMGTLMQPEVVVARVLSDSDVLVKTTRTTGDIAYSHRRWGYSKTGLQRRKWSPLSNPISKDEAVVLIQEFDFNSPKETFEGDIVGLPFEFKKLE